MTNNDLDVNVLSLNYIARSSEPIDNLPDGLDIFNDQPTKERDFEIKKFKTSKSSLFNAIEKDNFDIIKLILNNEKTSINNIVYCYDETCIVGNEMYTKHVDRTPLTHACDERKIELLNLLLENDKVREDTINILIMN
ncbi:hypothetical protein M9Y10_001854 [Tritrichomonas musculus]|uniref:Ankyrin repeat protein n=1 Tax=Tritrichomonas musculus TaxID=1915356 RepID=A0ABR2L917_9EUKA